MTRNELGLPYDLQFVALGAEETMKRLAHGLPESLDALVLWVIHDGAVRRLDPER